MSCASELVHKPNLIIIFTDDQGFDAFYGLPYSNDMTLDPKARFADHIQFREGQSLETIKVKKNLKKDWVPLMRDE